MAGVASGFADISPTKYVGSGIVAQLDADVRMESAKVEIVWGTPGTLSATFLMTNPTSRPQALTVGFPMPRGDESDPRAPDPLTISFDGVEAAVAAPAYRRPGRYDRPEWRWFECVHTFKPGTTQVVVKTVLRASGVDATPFRETLFYCLETGGNWAGTIGLEEVTIKFPHPILNDQITSAAPGGYRVEGNEVRWRFVDFKPKRAEYDIALTYVQPEVIQFIASLREAAAKAPESTAARIKLAKHLLALGNAKSNAGVPPLQLSLVEHTTIARRLKSAKQRQAFLAYYWQPGENGFSAGSPGWTPERLEMVQILADADYRDEFSRSPFILEGEQLLQDVLKRDPHQAEAWNLYLASYWRFSFAAIGHWFGVTQLSEHQAALIETAARNCPADETIQLWLQLRKSKPEMRNTDKLFEAIKRNGFQRLEFPEPKKPSAPNPEKA
jgi:hypothetical protein